MAEPSGPAVLGVAGGLPPLTGQHMTRPGKHSHAERMWPLGVISPTFPEIKPKSFPVSDDFGTSHPHTLQLVGDSPVGDSPFAREEMRGSGGLAESPGQVSPEACLSHLCWPRRCSLAEPGGPAPLLTLGTLLCSPLRSSCSLDVEPGQGRQASEQIVAAPRQPANPGGWRGWGGTPGRNAKEMAT